MSQTTPAASNLKKGKKMSYERKKSLYGYMFLGLWLVGIVWRVVLLLTPIRR